jgi:hypothetical protein
MTEHAKGFLGRWSHRKSEALKGVTTEEEPVLSQSKAAIAPPSPAIPETMAAATADAQVVVAEPQQEQVLSLDDARLLTKDSDFKPFMAQGVDASVRNAAMKKLFADPHFNVMDGLDTYIDDYSKSDPIPQSMLQQMAGAKFLKLFDDLEAVEKQQFDEGAREIANNPTGQTVAQSYENPNLASPDLDHPPNPSQIGPAREMTGPRLSQEDHADTDLRLQPDDATPAPATGRGTQ